MYPDETPALTKLDPSNQSVPRQKSVGSTTAAEIQGDLAQPSRSAERDEVRFRARHRPARLGTCDNLAIPARTLTVTP